MRLLRTIIIAVLTVISYQTYAARTIAISYFDNTTEETQFNALSKGITDMLITDLSKVEGLVIVEREKLEELIGEIKLGQSSYFNQETAQKLGKGLGAEAILTGAFFIMDDKLRIDARLIEVETSEVIFAEQVSGSTNDFFSIHSRLVELLAESLKISKKSGEKLAYKPVSISAMVSYSEAIDDLDKGLQEEGIKNLEKTLQENPGFVVAQDKLEKVRQNIVYLNQQREKALQARIEELMNNIDLESENWGMQISNSWTALMSSFYHTLVLEFNQTLIKKGVDLQAYPYGAGTMITVGEMIGFYNTNSYNQLKMHEEVINHGQQFMKDYPVSTYYFSVNSMVNTSLQELEERKKGAVHLERIIAHTSFLEYVTYLKRFSWYKNYMSEDDIKWYERTMKRNVLNYLNENPSYSDDFGASDLEGLFEVCIKLERTELAGEFVLLAEKLSNSTYDEEIVYDMKETLEEYNDDVREKNELKQELWKAYENNTEEDLYKYVDKSYQMRKSDSYDLMLEVSEKYLESEDNREASRAMRTRRTAWSNLFDVCKNEADSEQFESFLEAYSQDKLLKDYNEELFERNLKSFQKNLRNVKSYIRMYEQEIKAFPVQKGIFKEHAEVYRNQKQLIKEIKLRKQIIRDYKLDDDELGLQLFYLYNAYNNIGQFESAREYGNELLEKLPDNTYAVSVKTMMDYMPR